MTFRALRHAAPVAVSIVLGACADLTGIENVFAERLVSIGVTKGSIVEVGDTVRVKASGGISGISGLFGYDLLPDARWSVSDPTIAQVQPLPPPPADSIRQGQTLIRGIRAGITQVIATARGLSGEATVRVIPVISRIEVRTLRETVAAGDTISVTASAFDAAGLPVDGLQFIFTVAGGLKLFTWGDSTARAVAIASGPATLSARFRRAVGEATLIVVAARVP